MRKDKVRKTILNILAKNLWSKDYRIFLFGSRATGLAKRWSDYDIGIEGTSPIPLPTLGTIRADLEESGLPVRVEVVDLLKVGKQFRAFALKNAQLWKRP